MNEDNYRTLSRLVRQQRIALGYTPTQIADRAHIDRAIVSRIEAGKKIPTPETLAALAPVLGVPLTDLYTAAGYPVPQLPALRPYLRRAYNVPDNAVDEIERYLARISAEYGGGGVPRDGEDEIPE